MKPFTIAFLGLFSLSSYAQLDIRPDVIGAPSMELTQEELQEEKKTFLEFITRHRADEFIGHTQYVLSPLNLSIRANVKYSVELDGTVLFQLATAGNHWVTAGDVTFPMQGSVYFELKDKEGKPLVFETEDGEEVSFPGRKKTLYIVETEKAYQLRKKVQSKFMKASEPVGRFLAICGYDLFTQDIEFYELQENKKLLRRGSFNGNVAPRRRNW